MGGGGVPVPANYSISAKQYGRRRQIERSLPPSVHPLGLNERTHDGAQERTDGPVCFGRSRFLALGLARSPSSPARVVVAVAICPRSLARVV